MPDPSATDHADNTDHTDHSVRLDAELRRIAEALVADPPEHPDLFGAGAGDAPYVMPRRAPRRRVLLRAAAVVAALLGAAGLLAVAQGDPSDDVDLASPEPTPGLAAPNGSCSTTGGASWAPTASRRSWSWQGSTPTARPDRSPTEGTSSSASIPSTSRCPRASTRAPT